MDNLPFFVVIFNKMKDKVVYMNSHFRNTFFPREINERLVTKLLNHT